MWWGEGVGGSFVGGPNVKALQVLGSFYIVYSRCLGSLVVCLQKNVKITEIICSWSLEHDYFTMHITPAMAV